MSLVESADPETLLMWTSGNELVEDVQLQVNNPFYIQIAKNCHTRPLSILPLFIYTERHKGITALPHNVILDSEVAFRKLKRNDECGTAALESSVTFYVHDEQQFVSNAILLWGR